MLQTTFVIGGETPPSQNFFNNSSGGSKMVPPESNIQINKTRGEIKLSLFDNEANEQERYQKTGLRQCKRCGKLRKPSASNYTVAAYCAECKGKPENQRGRF